MNLKLFYENTKVVDNICDQNGNFNNVNDLADGVNAGGDFGGANGGHGDNNY